MDATPSEDERLAELAWLCGEGGYLVAVGGKPGRFVALFPFMFTTAIIEGRLGDRTGYDDRWCYQSADAALRGLVEWGSRDWQGEPQGWHRHPKSGRRHNPDGSEEVRP